MQLRPEFLRRCLDKTSLTHKIGSLSLLQYLYDRPALTAVNVFEETIPYCDFFPTATIGWLLEQGYLKDEWFKAIMDIFRGKMKSK